MASRVRSVSLSEWMGALKSAESNYVADMTGNHNYVWTVASERTEYEHVALRDEIAFRMSYVRP